MTTLTHPAAAGQITYRVLLYRVKKMPA